MPSLGDYTSGDFRRKSGDYTEYTSRDFEKSVIAILREQQQKVQIKTFTKWINKYLVSG